MIQQIKDSAKAVGIVALITNSTEGIEIQLNRLTREEDKPIMLVSWDIDTTLNFDTNGFLENPSSLIIALLVAKPEDLTKEVAEQVSEQMASLFRKFMQDLYKRMIPFQTSNKPPISGASYKHVPRHGAGKHSGVLGRFTMRSKVGNCT